MGKLEELWASTADFRGSLAAAARDGWEATADLRALALRAIDDLSDWIGSIDLSLPRHVAIALATLFLALAIPSIIAAWVERRIPTVGLVLLVLGGALAFWTVETYPGDYYWDDIPLAFIEVVAGIVN